MLDPLDHAYWTLYRYLQPLDHRLLRRRLLRWRIPPGLDSRVVTIRSGLGRGLRWQHRDGYSHFFWTGTYDHGMQRAMKRHVRPGHVVYDIGGNAGFHALLFGRLTGPAGRVFCFEPLAENIAMIELQLSLNHLPWCQVVPAAVSDREGSADLFLGTTNAVATLVESHSTGDGGGRVTTTTLDAFSRSHPPPDAVKMDIEGAEGLALAGARDMLGGRARPVFFIELHGAHCARAVVDVLLAHDYAFESLAGRPLTTAELPPRGQVVALPR